VKAAKEKWDADGVCVERLILNVKVATEVLAVATKALEARQRTWAHADVEEEGEPEPKKPRVQNPETHQAWCDKQKRFYQSLAQTVEKEATVETSCDKQKRGPKPRLPRPLAGR
jgi:hypothetical protein